MIDKRLYRKMNINLFAELFVAMALFRADTSAAFQNYNSPSRTPKTTYLQASAFPWKDIESQLGNCYREEPPVSIDSVFDTTKPTFSTTVPTLFRERHGWCPYSERVWLTLELLGMEHDSVRIDNTGGGRPSYFGGQTPQMKWPDGRTQGESMDLVEALDDGSLRSGDSQIQDYISQFRNIFPRARPSSRAAFLFQNSGEPLWRGTFEETLQGTDALLGQHGGPFFCGSSITAADIAWAPFLERYRYQLPCLHNGLDPADESTYPNLSKWYKAMDKIPAYACRVKGDASSWRKVLAMAGFGNAGFAPEFQADVDELVAKELAEAKACVDVNIWEAYASTRPYVASSPHADAASIVTKNRAAIIQDLLKQAPSSPWRKKGLPTTQEEADLAMRGLATALLSDGDKEVAESISGAIALAGFLDERMCVPRDMGAMSASTIKMLAS